MAKQLIPRPSGLERADLCPGSVAKEAPFPWTDSPAAARGRKMHEAMALLFQVGEGAFDTLAKNPEITEAEMKTIRECYQIGLDLTPDDPGRLVRVEQALELGFLGLSGGKPDLFYISPKYNAAVLIDWKFGGRPTDWATTSRRRGSCCSTGRCANARSLGLRPRRPPASCR